MSDVQPTGAKASRPKPAKGKAKKATKTGTKKAKPRARNYRLNLTAVEKVKAAIDGLENIITTAPANASGDDVSTSLRAHRRAALASLRALVAAARAKVKVVRKLRKRNFK